MFKRSPGLCLWMRGGIRSKWPRRLLQRYRWMRDWPTSVRLPMQKWISRKWEIFLRLSSGLQTETRWAALWGRRRMFSVRFNLHLKVNQINSWYFFLKLLFRNPNPCTAKGMICKNVVGYYVCHCPQGMRRNPLRDTCEGSNKKHLFSY